MKKYVIGPACSLALLYPVVCHSGEPESSYVSIQYGLGKYSEDGFDEAEPSILVGKYGYFFTEGFSLEGRIGFGMGDDSIYDPFIGELTIEVDSLVGVYGVGHAKLSDSFSVYALLGVTRGELTAEAPGFGISVSEDDSGLSYGVGMNIGRSESVGVNIEYTKYLSGSDYDFSAIGLGLVVPLN